MATFAVATRVACNDVRADRNNDILADKSSKPTEALSKRLQIVVSEHGYAAHSRVRRD